MSEKIANIDTMNADNVISNTTNLYGLIAEHASTNRLFVMVNRLIKAQKCDAMIIPMNIREDDFYFTVSNMKKSHVHGAYIAEEFQETVLDLLDIKDEVVEVYQRCDFVIVENELLHGYLVGTNNIDSTQELAQRVFEQFIKEK